MWILHSKADEERQRKDIEERFERKNQEQQAKAEAKQKWLKANTCPHCGQHPQMPPWFVDA